MTETLQKVVHDYGDHGIVTAVLTNIDDTWSCLVTYPNGKQLHEGYYETLEETIGAGALKLEPQHVIKMEHSAVVYKNGYRIFTSSAYAKPEQAEAAAKAFIARC